VYLLGVDFTLEIILQAFFALWLGNCGIYYRFAYCLVKFPEPMAISMVAVCRLLSAAQ